jgi:DNA-binding response OmpR family regulator
MPISILVIEREPQVMQRLLGLFRSAGYAPLLASSPCAAAAVLETERFDVVLTDDGDGVMSAEQLARGLRERWPASAPPVVRMTSDVMAEPSALFAATVTRPVDALELLHVVDVVARRHAPRSCA